MVPYSVFNKAKLLSESGDTDRYHVLRSILFSVFFNKQRTGLLGSVLRTIRNLLASRLSFPVISDTDDTGASIVVANTSPARHYVAIAGNLVSLFRNSGLDVTTVETAAVRKMTPWIAARSLVFLLWLSWRLWLLGVPIRSILPYAPLVIQRYKELMFSLERLSDQLVNAKAVVVINEDWMPSSALLYACWKLGVKTIHYPHGMIDWYNLPLKAEIQLCWNETMKESFQDKGGQRYYSVGFLETYNTEQKCALEIPIPHDVLITSQIHWKNHVEDGEQYSHIFDLWVKCMKRRPNLSVVIKLHPFDSAEDQAVIEEKFRRFGDRCLVMGGGVSLSWLISNCTIHASVDSGSILTALRYGKASLIYGDSSILEAHGFGGGCIAVKRIDDLLHHIDNLPRPQTKKWISNDQFIEENFEQFVATELLDDVVPLLSADEAVLENAH